MLTMLSPFRLFRFASTNPELIILWLFRRSREHFADPADQTFQLKTHPKLQLSVSGNGQWIIRRSSQYRAQSLFGKDHLWLQIICSRLPSSCICRKLHARTDIFHLLPFVCRKPDIWNSTLIRVLNLLTELRRIR